MQFPLSFLLRIMYVLFVFRLYYFTRFFRSISFKVCRSVCKIKCRRQDLTGFRVPGILETQSHDEYSRKIFRPFPFIHSVFR